MQMNQAEIEWAAQQTHACPNVRKGLQLLNALVTAVNEQSDGWAYWHPPGKACEQLETLLQTAGNLTSGTSGVITDGDLQKAIIPIRRMVTVQREKQKQYGNMFEFDVDAALTPSPE